MIADIAVLDPNRLRDRATYASPFEHSLGVEWVFLAGKPAIAAGNVTDELRGRPLRKGLDGE